MFRERTLACLFLLCTSTLGLISAGQRQSNEVELVSILQLIATPEKYDGKEILVVGFLRLEFEGNILYLHEDDYNHHIYKNGLWVTRNAKINENAGRINLHYAIIKGTFDAVHKGHMSLNSGTITNITDADTWPDTQNLTRKWR